MSSILTNSSALVALQTLKSTNSGLAKAQNEISTGMRVATAKDNSSSWSIASTMQSDVGSLKKLGESLTTGSALVGTARAAAEQISGILKEIQTKVVQGKNPGADTAKLDAEIAQLTGAINNITETAQFNGVNLVKATPDSAAFQMSLVRTTAGALSTGAAAFTVAGVDLSVGTAPTTASTVDAIDTLIDAANSAAASFGAAQMRIEAQSTFLGKQMDALKNGVSALVDADMEEASSRLSALQVQQQLGIQALSIANSAPQNVLSLFR